VNLKIPQRRAFMSDCQTLTCRVYIDEMFLANSHVTVVRFPHANLSLVHFYTLQTFGWTKTKRVSFKDNTAVPT